MIYITGDVHREMDIWKINPDDGFTEGKQLTDKDYVIICGDFGCIWDGATGDEFWLKWLASLPWNTVFLDGNHENFDLLKTYPIEQWNGGLVHKIRHNIFHLMRGEVYNIDGIQFLSFGGGYSHDLCYRTEHVNWWKDELPTDEEVSRLEINLMKTKYKVDYVLSHDIYRSHPLSKRYPVNLECYGSGYQNIHDVLEKIYEKVSYKAWFNGHYHQDSYLDGERPCFTLFNKVIQLDTIEQIKKHFD